MHMLRVCFVDSSDMSIDLFHAYLNVFRESFATDVQFATQNEMYVVL